MIKPWIRNLAIGTLCAGCVWSANAAADDDDDDDDRGMHYRVTVTNITRGEVFTPIMVATHKQGVRLFELGEPASTELAMLAEAGDTGPLSEALEDSGKAFDVVTGPGPLPPGHSQTIVVKTRGKNDHISLAAMLVPTNDGFIALNGVRGPRGHHTMRLVSPGYDAGSENNDELCVHIPGPPMVCGGEGFNAADGEGYVHIHAGIHGIGDLVAADRDWRNPVAAITIERMNKKDDD